LLLAPPDRENLGIDVFLDFLENFHIFMRSQNFNLIIQVKSREVLLKFSSHERKLAGSVVDVSWLEIVVIFFNIVHRKLRKNRETFFSKTSISILKVKNSLDTFLSDILKPDIINPEEPVEDSLDIYLSIMPHNLLGNSVDSVLCETVFDNKPIYNSVDINVHRKIR